ncbi:unnamed protein product [Periconia digitata]|uniref:Uncharacterized protein n=1 Tax=Periconia digitata TaxID=1303443 RepID=A0A9W4XRC8_9PLEO|nr:unnamed protein product [Periconia digitata]
MTFVGGPTTTRCCLAFLTCGQHFRQPHTCHPGGSDSFSKGSIFREVAIARVSRKGNSAS